MGTEGQRRPTVVLGVTGSIAAYKAAHVARLLVKAGVRVLPVMTESATKMLGPATLAGITGESVRSDMWAPGTAGELHVELAAAADLVAVVPATAELLSSLVAGSASDLLRATLLSARGPVVLAPAMHPRMWSHPATSDNVATLRMRGVELVGPVVGEVASGDVGEGRMAEPEAIAAAILGHLGPRDLEGRHVVVSAGPTVEDIDPARYLSNRSSGKMGYAVAEAAVRRGARVTLVSGPVALQPPSGVALVEVRSAHQMQAALAHALGPELRGADAVIMAAAVADYRPATVHEAKLKRVGPVTLELVPNPDLLAELGRARHGARPVLVGFALETVTGDDLVSAARKKLEKKRVDLVVANTAVDAFERDDNRIMLVDRERVRSLPQATKRALADRILDHLVTLLKD
ncbi:MAG: bifunctional phosphopantothenoylcysteine decarboxylase/phosphopantothenate--cysteine ligase CoaBC [Deltaproteobacteria bacterium]|nr:bifunctional phosphopantothenoylcysteine decarboxylase/phosphopantothenate--cysteine ligase CoaBC [Deltaproteobacteria bacterium]